MAAAAWASSPPGGCSVTTGYRISYDRAMTWSLADTIREHGRERGALPMITFGARTITCAEMDARSTRVAHGLLAAGLPQQVRDAFVPKNPPAKSDAPSS